MTVFAIVVLLVVIAEAAATLRDRRRHAASLANIVRLERELFPEWFPDRSTRMVYGSGGYRWHVENADDVRYIPKDAWLNDSGARWQAENANAVHLAAANELAARHDLKIREVQFFDAATGKRIEPE